MIKKFFTLLCLCTLCIGSAWGEATTYSMTIDSSNNGSNNVHWTGSSISSLTYDNITWSTSVTGTTSFTASTTQCQIGSKNNPATKVTISTTGFAGKKITKVAVTCFCMTNTGPTLTVKAGSTTMINASALVKTTSTEMKSADGTYATLGVSDDLTIEFNSSAKAAIVISKIEVTYEEGTTPTGPSLSVSPATIDFGEVYQNAEVEAQDVTVSFSNLTTNDVAAAISGSVFDINKTGSFTSGDKITITPNTANLGVYSETLTVSATGVESKEVTITMNVVAAPVMENYTLVTDASILKDGNVIVLGAVKDDNWYVNGGINGKYLDSKDATCEDGILESSDAVEITLKETTGGWYLKIGETYINTTAEKALTFADEASTAWTISIDENGDATIAAGDNGRFLYNATSPRFLNYTSKTSASMLLPQIYRKEVSAKITSTGYATFSSDYALNLSNLPEGLTAYKATTAGNDKVHMVAVEEAVAANTGLFLKGTENATYTIPVAASGNALEGNLLEATNGGEVEAGDYVYVIASGAFQPLANNTVVSKGKAYIPKDAITTSGKLEISFDDPTGINNVANVKAADSKMYNLQGVQVSKNYNGIVIMNGKKYLNK